jgi:hypothetical protein
MKNRFFHVDNIQRETIELIKLSKVINRISRDCYTGRTTIRIQFLDNYRAQVIQFIDGIGDITLFVGSIPKVNNDLFNWLWNDSCPGKDF